MKAEQRKQENGMVTEDSNVEMDDLNLMATNCEIENCDVPTEEVTIDKHETWFEDLETSVHITNNDLRMFNTRPCNFGVTIRDGR